MVKILGISLVFVSAVGMGIYSSYKTQMGIKQLREMINFMQYIRTQIEYFNTPINSIYSNFNSADHAFLSIVCDISANGWKNTLESSSCVYLPEKTKNLLSEYGSYLGKSNKEEQLIHNKYYIQLLEKEYAELEKKGPEKIKLSLALGLYAGLMLIILFI